METRSTRKTRRQQPKVNARASFEPLQIPSETPSTSGLVIDLTRESTGNQLLPTELVPQTSGRSITFRLPRNSFPEVECVLCHDVIDLSTPEKQSSPRKRSHEESPEESYRKSLIPGCPICLEKLEFIDPGQGKRVTTTQCGHMFCQSCIVPFIRERQRCPTCRRKQTLSNLISLFP